jgi:hypothetical protein
MAAAAPVTQTTALSRRGRFRTYPVRGKAVEPMAAGRRAAVMTPLAWMAVGHQGESGSVMGRIALVAVALVAVGAFAVLQIKARSNRQRSPSGPRRRHDPFNPSDWRTLPPPHWPGGRDDEGPLGNEERYRPDRRYGYPPGYEPYPLYDPARSPWAARDDAARDPRSLGGTGPERPAAFQTSTLRA